MRDKSERSPLNDDPGSDESTIFREVHAVSVSEVSQADPEIAKHLLELHVAQWSSGWQWLALAAAFFVLQTFLFFASFQKSIWVFAPLWLLLAHVMHGQLLAFHESAHRTLLPNRGLNDAVGVLIGCFSLTSLTLFRTIHLTHHTLLTSEGDEELWPYVIPGIARWKRQIAALLELTLGLVYTPTLFLYMYFRPGSRIRSRRVRRRIAVELGCMSALWATILTAVVHWHGERQLFIAYLIPALIAADFSSLRKFIEHLGLFGESTLTATRSVVDRTLLGRLISLTLFNETYHGVHHTDAAIPQHCLPAALSLAYQADASGLQPFRGYGPAFLDMIEHLRDPRVGSQWLCAGKGVLSSCIRKQERCPEVS